MKQLQQQVPGSELPVDDNRSGRFRHDPHAALVVYSLGSAPIKITLQLADWTELHSLLGLMSPCVFHSESMYMRTSPSPVDPPIHRSLVLFHATVHNSRSTLHLTPKLIILPSLLLYAKSLAMV